MAYVHKLIEKDEELIGIANLHWIYILKGMGWFFAMAFAGWAFNALMTRGMSALASFSGSSSLPVGLFTMGNMVSLFFLTIGFLIFSFYVIKVISTHIALTNRRVIHKWGMIMVKVEQIDLEEVRGENLDLGWFGRFLGYAYIDLDCRFIGDVKLDAIENPERFIRALHHQRANTQDALNVMLGKGNTVMPLNLVDQNDGQQPSTVAADDPNKQQPENPQPETPHPPARPEIDPQPVQPEIQPPQTPTEIPAPPNQPMPNQPPPLNQDQQAGEQAKKNDTPYNDRQQMIDQDAPMQEAPKTQGQVQKKAQVQQQAAQVVEQVKQEAVPSLPQDAEQIPAETVQKIVEQVTPQIAQEVVRQMEEQGLVSHNDNASKSEQDIAVDNDLIHVFDDAALTKEGRHNGPDNKDRVGYAIN